MIDGFTQAQVIGALFGVIGGLILIVLAMVGAFFGWVVRNIHTLREDMHQLNRETRSELAARLDRIDARLEAVTIAVSRLEGAVYHGLPEPRRAVE